MARRRPVLTPYGPLNLDRPYRHSAACDCGWSVVETTLGLDARARVRPGLRAWLVRLGATTDFREAAALLAELTRLALGAKTVLRQTETTGVALRTVEDAVVAQVARTREPVEPAAGALLMEVDGSMLQYLDGWPEVKLGLVAGCDDGAVVAPSYAAARTPPLRHAPACAPSGATSRPMPHA